MSRPDVAQLFKARPKVIYHPLMNMYVIPTGDKKNPFTVPISKITKTNPSKRSFPRILGKTKGKQMMAEDLFQDIPLIELGNLDNDMLQPTVAPTFKPTVPMTVAPTDDMFSDVNISDLTPDFIENNVTGQMSQLYSEKANMGGVGEAIDVGKDHTGNSLKDLEIRAKVQGLADRPNEQDWMLEPHFGKDGTYRDSFGALWIRGKALENAGLEDRDEEHRGKDIRLDALPFTGGLKEFAVDASADISGDVAEVVLPMATFLMTKGSGVAAAGVRSLVSE